ncbi:MAG: hypothetical protein RIM99_05355 [Cyclobacteriaceae bacterium]
MKKLLFIPLLIIACQTSKNEEVDLAALKDEVLEIHDEVMPKMGDLRRARKELMLLADSIQTIDSARAAELLIASDSIDMANEGMMNWMRNYEPTFEGTDEEILEYLTNQKEAIVEVKIKMITSLEIGKKLLEGN